MRWLVRGGTYIFVWRVVLPIPYIGFYKILFNQLFFLTKQLHWAQSQVQRISMKFEVRSLKEEISDF